MNNTHKSQERSIKDGKRFADSEATGVLTSFSAFAVMQTSVNSTRPKISSYQGHCKAGSLITRESLSSLPEVRERTHVSYGRKEKEGGEVCLLLMGRTGSGQPGQKASKRVNPELALILKVVRSHLRKWGV